MTNFTLSLKHHILTQYQPFSHIHSFHALARLYNVKGGASTIQKWHRRWDGTAQSLERLEGSGRPRLLSRIELTRHVAPRIRAANRRAEAVHYSTIHASVEAATGRHISQRTLRRYGQELHAKQKREQMPLFEESIRRC